MKGSGDKANTWVTVGSLTLSPGTYILCARAVLCNADIQIEDSNSAVSVGSSARNYTEDDVSVSTMSVVRVDTEKTYIAKLKKQNADLRTPYLDGNATFHTIAAIRMKE